jgi:hypothetical protein
MPPFANLEAAKEMLNFYRGNRVLAVTILSEEWKRGTDAGMLKVRSSEFEAIDAALRDYHAHGKTEASFVRLRQTFDNWIRAQQRAGKNWNQSERNKNGLVSKLHEQIVLVDAGRSVKQMGQDDWEARMALVVAEREALQALFSGRHLGFKSAFKTKVRQALSNVKPVGELLKAGREIAKGADGVSAQDVADSFSKLHNVPQKMASAFGVSADALCSGCANVLNHAVAPAKLLNDLRKLASEGADRVTASRSRYAFNPGNADAALSGVIQLIDQELLLIGKDMVQHTAATAAQFLGGGPIVSMANAVVDLIVNHARYVQMIDEMERGNMDLLRRSVGLEVFESSPVLGCYFLLMADTSMWVNFSAHDIGTDGWMRQVESMAHRAEPVRARAREFIRQSKYALSGTEGFNGLEWVTAWESSKKVYIARHWERACKRLDELLGEAPDGTLDRPISGVRGAKHAKVPAGRIVGFGNP